MQILVDSPTRNVAHVTCMLHAKNKKFHDACLTHVSILTNMHVSCNMQGFGTFYLHVTCAQHAYNMHTHVMTCMQHACYNMHITVAVLGGFFWFLRTTPFQNSKFILLLSSS